MLCQLSYASTEWITMQAGTAGTVSARKIYRAYSMTITQSARPFQRENA